MSSSLCLSQSNSAAFEGYLIESDSQVFDLKSKSITFIGNVIFSHNGLDISAEKLTFYGDDDIRSKPDKVIAEGNPAKFEARLEAGQPRIKGSSKIIEYHEKTKILNLIENAMVDQDGTILTGYRIEYYTLENTVKAKGKDTDGKEGRVKLVIPPKLHQR